MSQESSDCEATLEIALTWVCYSQEIPTNNMCDHDDGGGRRHVCKDLPKVLWLYLDTEVIPTPVLYSAHLAEIGWDEDGLDGGVMN